MEACAWLDKWQNVAKIMKREKGFRENKDSTFSLVCDYQNKKT